MQFKRAEYTERRSTLKTRTDKIFFGVYWGGEVVQNLVLIHFVVSTAGYLPVLDYLGYME